MLHHDFLSLGRGDEQRKPIRGGRRTGHDGEAVVGADRERIRQRDDLLAGILLLREPRIGAVEKKDVGGAVGEECPISDLLQK